MSGTFWRTIALSIGAIFASFTASYAADDVIRLGGIKSADTVRLNGTGTLKDNEAIISRLDLRNQDEDDTSTVGFRYYGGYRGGFYGGYRGGFYGGYRGFYGGYRGGYYGGYYGGYRGFYPRYAYGFGYSYYPQYYYPRYSIGIGFGSYYTPYYSSYSYYSPYVYGGYYCPIGGSTTIVQVPTQTLQILPDRQPVESRPMSPTIEERIPDQTLPLPKGTPNQDGSFKYDGGPMNPVPMPRQDLDSSKQSSPRVVPDRSVSIRSQPQQKKYTYPAYGEKPAKEPKKTDEKFVSVKASKP